MFDEATLKKQQELHKIDRQRNVNNKGATIQMSPLHTALVNVHREYNRTNQATKDIGRHAEGPRQFVERKFT